METRATKKRMSKKRKKISKRRVRRTSRADVDRIGSNLESGVDAMRTSARSLSDLAEEVQDGLLEIGSAVSDLEDLSKQMRTEVKKDDVLPMLRVILNLNEDDELVLDAFKSYVPLERPRVPLSQLQRIALELHEKVKTNADI